MKALDCTARIGVAMDSGWVLFFEAWIGLPAISTLTGLVWQ